MPQGIFWIPQCEARSVHNRWGSFYDGVSNLKVGCRRGTGGLHCDVVQQLALWRLLQRHSLTTGHRWLATQLCMFPPKKMSASLDRPGMASTRPTSGPLSRNVSAPRGSQTTVLLSLHLVSLFFGVAAAGASQPELHSYQFSVNCVDNVNSLSIASSVFNKAAYTNWFLDKSLAGNPSIGRQRHDPCSKVLCNLMLALCECCYTSH